MVSTETFREMALSFPDAVEKPHFEVTSFRSKKIFASMEEERNRVCLMLSEIDQAVFCAIDRNAMYPVPNKWGKQGATYVELKLVRKTVLRDALRHSYEWSITKKPKK